jgi:hypothetical protein
MPTPTIELNRFIRLLALLLIAGVLAACSMVNYPWGKADDYVTGLRCGMAESELQTYSEQYPGLEIRNSDEFEFLVARKGNTQVLLWLETDGLIAYQITWTYPPTNFDSQLKTDLCTGDQYVELNLVGRSELAGAGVWLDGERVGELSRSGSFTWDVTLGAHQLRVEKPGSGSWATELRYDAASVGYDRLPIPEDSFPLGDNPNSAQRK